MSLKAVEYCRTQGIKVVSLTGRLSTPLGEASDVCVCTQGTAYSDRVQELHIKVIHIIIELIEREVFPSKLFVDYTQSSPHQNKKKIFFINPLNYTITHSDSETRARTGRLETMHGYCPNAGLYARGNSRQRQGNLPPMN